MLDTVGSSRVNKRGDSLTPESFTMILARFAGRSNQEAVIQCSINPIVPYTTMCRLLEKLEIKYSGNPDTCTINIFSNTVVFKNTGDNFILETK